MTMVKFCTGSCGFMRKFIPVHAVASARKCTYPYQLFNPFFYFQSCEAQFIPNVVSGQIVRGSKSTCANFF